MQILLSAVVSYDDDRETVCSTLALLLLNYLVQEGCRSHTLVQLCQKQYNTHGYGAMKVVHYSLT